MFIFTACGSPATKSNSSKKLNEIDTQKNENKDENISENKIVWVLPEEFIKITKLQDNTEYLNQQLKKDGYKSVPITSRKMKILLQYRNLYIR